MGGKARLWRPLAIRSARALKTAEHWAVAQIARAALWLLRRLAPDRALDLADRAARRIGPFSARHRVALDNLRLAWPEKSEAERAAIASEMWGNMGRLAAEYVFLGEVFDFDPQARESGRIEIEGVEIFERLREEPGRPHIFFTAHIGSFELLPVAAATFGLNLTALFRAPNNPYLAEYVFDTRSRTMGDLLASRTGAALGLARVLEGGGNIGLLVDQKFRKGVPSAFFGRECRTSPLLAKLARQFECDVYPAFCVRLPGNRYRLHLLEKIELPRTQDGHLDVAGIAQMLNDTVEGWVRMHPGQWMWFHKRWG